MTMDRKSIIKKIAAFIGTAVFFIVISYAFVPQVLSGKIVNQSDISGWQGMARETMEYNHAHPDDKTAWTNSMFGGMPNVTMYDDFDGDWTKPIYEFLLTGARPATYIFAALLGGFLLMLSFGVNWWIAIAGAIAMAFCSYNMQIIQVGHNTKMQAIAFMPWVLAGMVYTYRCAMKTLPEDGAKAGWKAWLPQTAFGATLFAFALSFQIKANHPQITYYLAIIIFIYAIVWLVWLCTSADRRKMLGRFIAASSLLLVIGGAGIASNLNKLLPTMAYAPYTMRGGSELTPEHDMDNSDGLALDYATAWSYGIEETPNLMIPDFNGGPSSGEIRLKESETEQLLRSAGQPNLRQVMKNMPLYWGPQPFTAGPMYMGAVTIFLFVLGLFLCDRKEKWWLAIATVIAISLAWGSHFMWFTRLWFEYAPLYSKFRTVSMALVILQITLPVLGFVVLDRIMRGTYEKKRFTRSLLLAFAVCGGFCLVFWIFPGLAGTFTGAADSGFPDALAAALADDRRSLLAKDAGRSFLLITAAAGLVYYLFSRTYRPQAGTDKKNVLGIMAAGLLVAILVVIDLFPVGKRYLNKDHFVTKRDFSGQFAQRPVDKMILEDPALDYRVLDISVNTFNDSHPSYWHKSIGGYSPAKMQRYQDLIEKYLTGEINSIIRTVNSSATIQDVEASLPEIPVTSMLNGKYVIIGGEYPPVVNSNAFGNCWFVESAAAAQSPDDEILLLGKTDLRTCAVIGNDFSWAREKLDSLGTLARTDIAPADTIWMTSYSPKELHYKSCTHSERAVIFSEIYYPEGWELTIDGAPAELFRADWILRGAFVPAGEHEIVMRFNPQSYIIGERLSRAASATLILLLLLSCASTILTAVSAPKVRQTSRD